MVKQVRKTNTQCLEKNVNKLLEAMNPNNSYTAHKQHLYRHVFALRLINVPMHQTFSQTILAQHRPLREFKGPPGVLFSTKDTIHNVFLLRMARNQRQYIANNIVLECIVNLIYVCIFVRLLSRSRTNAACAEELQLVKGLWTNRLIRVHIICVSLVFVSQLKQVASV